MRAPEILMVERDGIVTTRVIVSCDTSPLGTTAIDAAAALARGLDAELKGIFVEDINLFRMAALPFTRDIASATASASRLLPSEVQRVLEHQARSVRKVLAQVAAARSLPWSFQVIRGLPMGCVLEAMKELDVAVFGHAGRYSARAPAPASQGALAAQGVVMVVYDGSPAAHRALAAAQALVQKTHHRLVIATLGKSNGNTRARLEQSYAHALFVTLKRRDAEAVRRAAGTFAPAVLLWGGLESEADRATVATLVDALQCPVVLVT